MGRFYVCARQRAASLSFPWPPTQRRVRTGAPRPGLGGAGLGVAGPAGPTEASPAELAELAEPGDGEFDGEADAWARREVVAGLAVSAVPPMLGSAAPAGRCLVLAPEGRAPAQVKTTCPRQCASCWVKERAQRFTHAPSWPLGDGDP